MLTACALRGLFIYRCTFKFVKDSWQDLLAGRGNLALSSSRSWILRELGAELLRQCLLKPHQTGPLQSGQPRPPLAKLLHPGLIGQSLYNCVNLGLTGQSFYISFPCHCTIIREGTHGETHKQTHGRSVKGLYIEVHRPGHTEEHTEGQTEEHTEGHTEKHKEGHTEEHTKGYTGGNMGGHTEGHREHTEWLCNRRNERTNGRGLLIV